MIAGPIDLAQVRLDNALALFEEFVRHAARHADAATLRGLERRFAERLQIQPSYWSQIKNRSRQIGERLARQFEHLCHKPRGWMDEPHEPASPTPAHLLVEPTASTDTTATRESEPRDDDERFIVGLVLTYYRRHPQRARTRLLDLLGEVLVPSSSAEPAAGLPRAAALTRDPPPARREPSPPADEGAELWRRTSSGIAPLKHRK